MSMMVVSGFSLEAARPECLFGEDVPLFYVLSISRVGLPLATLMLVVFAHLLVFAFRLDAEHLERGITRMRSAVEKRAPTRLRRMSSKLGLSHKKKQLRRWTVAAKEKVSHQLGNLSHRVMGTPSPRETDLNSARGGPLDSARGALTMRGPYDDDDEEPHKPSPSDVLELFLSVVLQVHGRGTA